MKCISPNCGHEVKKNYYGGWIHANQWQDHCSIEISNKIITKLTGIAITCGCTKPKGDIE